jgi:hypothetical protein
MMYPMQGTHVIEWGERSVVLSANTNCKQGLSPCGVRNSRTINGALTSLSLSSFLSLRFKILMILQLL